MIETSLREMLSDTFRELIWSENNYTANDNTGTVYYESGGNPSDYEDEMRYPNYMIYIRSSDYTKAQNIAQDVFNFLHRKENIDINVPIYKSDSSDEYTRIDTYRIYFIHAQEPIRVGVNEDIMEYSVNIVVTLRKLKIQEEITNG